MTEQTPEQGTGTVYLVLKEIGGGADTASWRVLEVTVQAPNTNAAIKLAASKLPEAERRGKFVAIPHRNWQPVQVREEVKRELVIGS